MADTPKIRILWIDDRERVSGYPEKALPGTLSKWFEVVHPSSSDAEAMSYSSASDFMKEFKFFWFQKKADNLPVEIIAADYNLKKKAAAARGQSKPRRELGVSAEDKDSGESAPSLKDASPRLEEVDFDGLLIGAYYATLTYRHPAALISITNYLGAMPSEVDTLHELITPFLSVATENDDLKQHGDSAIWHNLIATERSWENIVRAALMPLRERIAELYRQGQIVIPPRDLIEIMNGRDNGVVRIISHHASRTIPIQGLFWDNTSNPKQWAGFLLESKITREQYINSEKVAKEIWSNYNNDALVDEQARLSMLHLTRGQSNCEYEDLKGKFGLTKTSRGKTEETHECTTYCSEIRKYGCNPEEKAVRRWAALFLIRSLLKRILVFIDATNIRSVTRNGEKKIHSLFPTIEEDDILLLLYPVPTSPFPLLWHLNNAKLRDNKKGGWRKWMKDNLGFQPRDVLDGSVLTIGERQILQGVVMEEDWEFGPDSKARLDRWKSFEPARLFLFGPDGLSE